MPARRPLTRRRRRAAQQLTCGAVAALAATLLLSAIACERDDIGTLCGESDLASFVPEPVAGETPIVDVRRLQRDRQCETFQCVTHAGLAPYCTRECRFIAGDSGSPPVCSSDADCEPPNSCYEGLCRDDDCPKGFWCRPIHPTGPLADKRYCLRREGCSANFDCEDLGRIVCREMGCFDTCCRSNATCEFEADALEAGGCAFHQLVCESYDGLGCLCSDGTTDCGDADRICRPEDATDQWPAGAVSRLRICIDKSL